MRGEPRGSKIKPIRTVQFAPRSLWSARREVNHPADGQVTLGGKRCLGKAGKRGATSNLQIGTRTARWLRAE